jgi:hypothetical protein
MLDVGGSYSARANTFPPNHNNNNSNHRCYYDASSCPTEVDGPSPPVPVPPPLPQCYFVNPSSVEHVVIDGPSPSQGADGPTDDDNRHHHSTFSLSSSPPPPHLPSQVQQMLYQGRRVCTKALRIARDRWNHPSVQRAVRRSASTSSSVGRHVARSSVQAYRSARDFDERHRISQQVLDKAQRGIHRGAQSMKNQLNKWSTTVRDHRR